MTVTTQGLSPQGLTAQGMGIQAGSFGSPFPPPIGTEQFLGSSQAFGGQLPISAQPGYPAQSPFGLQVPYGNHVPNGQLQAQPIIGQLVGQILPLAQQAILPQVIAMTTQVVQQLIAQLAVPQMSSQPFWGQPTAASFAPGWRQYASQF